MAKQRPQSAPSASTSLSKLANQTQLQFELEFFAGVLVRHPSYVEALKLHAKNLAVEHRHEEGLQYDRRIAGLRPDDSLAHYNLACSFALTHQADEALASLRKAVELGYRDFKYMKQDRDLESIRKDPRFRTLIREYDPNQH
jgi:Flp pilus assembly protein TadD